MKLQFKHQAYQAQAVAAVADCFLGQPFNVGLNYRIEPSDADMGQQYKIADDSGFRNHEIVLKAAELLKNIQAVQQRQNLPVSTAMMGDKKTGCPVNLDIEMETGTGKTYCYIKTIFELNRRYGWGKFIIVVPSIAIREGVNKALQITKEHFLEDYGIQARFFIYNSKQLYNLESFSSDAGINVMVINVQAFNATGKDARRIYEELDDFQSRRPIEVISHNRPILILDEPQKMGGAKTLESLQKFEPLMILRYSATHKTEYNKIHRLDALDAYNQKLVKKIRVRGIALRNLSGINPYLYLGGIDIAPTKPPTVRVELEIKQKDGIKRVLRKLNQGDNLHELSGGLEQYKGFVVSDINAHSGTLSFLNGVELTVGEAAGDVNEETFRRIQIRESIKAHIDKEQILFSQGIKVLTLFFIDSVAKYRRYDENREIAGEYARVFEEEYTQYLNEVISQYGGPYSDYVRGIAVAKTHEGYFSIDKKSQRLVDPETGRRSTETDDVDAYDLILRDKERLLSFDEPVRFIFSHSALREGWDNPNVFVICTLKHSDNTISRRQEVGRGMRLAVNQQGERMDDPKDVHKINELTVVTNESYTQFVSALQQDICEALSARPRKADQNYFIGKVLTTPTGEVKVNAHLANLIYHYLVRNDYVDGDDNISPAYHEAKQEGTLAELRPELAIHAEAVFQLIDGVFSESQLPAIENDRKGKLNPLNANFDKREFQELWRRINQKAVYTVHFDTQELVQKCVSELDESLRVSPLQYTLQTGELNDAVSYDEIKHGEGFGIQETVTRNLRVSVRSSVKYDLIGKLAENTLLTRKAVASILQGIKQATFEQFRTNPEEFIAKAARLINEQKATVIVEHLVYDTLNESHSTAIFTQEKYNLEASKTQDKLKRHIYDYVMTDSKVESHFVKELETSDEVVVYAKLPKGFFIPTPVGDYNPDWAIAFKQGAVKHIYFVAETKGSLSSMELRSIEKSKIECARKFFAELSNKFETNPVKYEVVESYGKLMEWVK